MKKPLSQVKLFLMDMDGTVYVGVFNGLVSVSDG